MKLEGRTVLITGGTSGIGFELARQLIVRRNTVIITGRDPRKLEEAKAALSGVHTFHSDASRPEDIESLRQRVTAEFPACDTLFNNAGIMRNLNMNEARPLTDVTRELDVNLNGPVQMVQAFVPHLKNRPNALIVNVSSGLAFVPFPLSPIYSAAKAGMHAFTRCLRVQLKGSNVKVVELAPPGVETKLFRGEFEKEMKGQKGMPVEILVTKAITGIEAGNEEVRPGLSNILYLLSRLAPALPFRQMAKMVRHSNSWRADRSGTLRLYVGHHHHPFPSPHRTDMNASCPDIGGLRKLSPISCLPPLSFKVATNNSGLHL